MRDASLHTFRTFDGCSLRYRCWRATREAAAEKRVYVILHRGHEHSGRLQHIVDELDSPEVAMYAWDARGHGLSEGPRGFSPSFGTSVRDLDDFVRFVAKDAGVDTAQISLIAQSVGAVLAATWAHDYAPRIRAMVLASPAFQVKLYVPLARPGLRLLQGLIGSFTVNSYVKAHLLTHDEERAASYESDPLITRPIASHILLQLYEAAERVVADSAAITLPTQVLISGDDWVVEQDPQHQFYANLGSQKKEKHVLAGFYHDTLGEARRELAFKLMRRFLDDVYAEPPVAPHLTESDEFGYTAREYEALQEPLSIFNPKRAFFELTRLGMSSLGWVSEGFSLGLDSGFDSGSTLDYVYRNEARGKSIVGKLVDRVYLDSIGWRGIRVRKKNLESLIRQAAESIRGEGQAVRIVDIAAGHGRYVLDAIAQAGEVEHVLLRDYSPRNVTAGEALIETRGLGDKARFERGDAFDEESLATMDPAPTLAIVSGLYELFPENEPIQTSLRGLAAAVPAGGFLVYTNQPWHPQLELIARALTSHRDHQPWVMRRRTQGEMDALVREAGFEKVQQLQDEWGIFTVSLARRTDA